MKIPEAKKMIVSLIYNAYFQKECKEWVISLFNNVLPTLDSSIPKVTTVITPDIYKLTSAQQKAK